MHESAAHEAMLHEVSLHEVSLHDVSTTALLASHDSHRLSSQS